MQGPQVTAALSSQRNSSTCSLLPSLFASLRSFSAVTFNQRRNNAACAGERSVTSAFSSPKNLKRGNSRFLKRSPGSGVPQNSPLRGLLPQHCSGNIEEDILSASLALTGVAAHLQLPRVMREVEDFFGDQDAELTSLLKRDECMWQEDVDAFQCSGRSNPIAPQLQLREFQLPRMHAQRPQDAVFVQAHHL
jgi:hypothetical protein